MSEEFEREPRMGADQTRSAPGGVGGSEHDPAPAAGTAPTAGTEPSQTAPSPPRATNAGRVWVAIAIATVLLILLIIFIAENSGSVTIAFLGAHGHISLALALLIAAVVGPAVTLLVGSARILQLRLEVRRGRSRTASAQSQHPLPH